MSIVRTLGKVIAVSTIVLTAVVANAAPVNINTADVKTLAASISGIGPKKADAIIAYRKAKGPFKSIQELSNVKGIGLKLIEKNKSDLFLSDAAMKLGKKHSDKN